MGYGLAIMVSQVSKSKLGVPDGLKSGSSDN